ncbi:putative transcriptional regulator [Firmicutes bacterium CAG:424]|nr:putative transcriptional regulator [Firmicutes bacterium CAG:424]
MAENQNVEWKELWKDEYLKWICGFANAQGGKIYIGKKDDGTVIGLQDSKKLLEDIPNKVRDVLGIIVDVNLLTEDGKDYIEIRVNSNSYPVNYKGEYHYRSGSTKQQLKGQALNQFLLQKTGITWDSVPIQGVTIEDLRNDSFDIFREQAVRSKRIDKKDIDASNEQLLDSLNLLENNHLKRAAILLFHHNPEKWIPGEYIKIGYFESDSELRYQDEIHGSLISQADKVVDLIFTKYLKADISYQGVTRVETYPFPKEAIREAVFNAIAHKFYGALIPIQISVYAIGFILRMIVFSQKIGQSMI